MNSITIEQWLQLDTAPHVIAEAIAKLCATIEEHPNWRIIEISVKPYGFPKKLLLRIFVKEWL